MSKYVHDKTFDVSTLRHDLQAFVLPLEIAFELSISPAGDPKVMILRDEILKSLKLVVGELNSLPGKLEIKG